MRELGVLTREVLEPITFVLAYPTVYARVGMLIRMEDGTEQRAW